MDDQSHNRSQSLSPSVRRGDRHPLRSSPLAGHSYSADKGGNLIEHSSALEQELERRRIDNGLPTPPASRKVSVDESESPRRARPSFISLAPRPGSRDSLAPPTPASPTLRSRHSSPHIVANPRFSQSTSSLPHAESRAKPRASADWMTAAPAPSFSRLAARSSGVVLPVKASSREGERLRHKSLPPKSAAPKPVPKGDSNNGEHVKTLKSFRSMGKVFKHDHDHEVENVSPVPPTPLGPGSHAHSRASPINSPQDVSTAKGTYLEPSVVTREHERGRVRKLWWKVMGGVKRSKA